MLTTIGAYPKFITQGFNENYLPLWLQEGGVNTYYVGKFSNGHSIETYLDPPAAGWTGSKYDSPRFHSKVARLTLPVSSWNPVSTTT